MNLVIDANIVMSALIAAQGKTADLLFNDELHLFAPEFLFEEIKKYREEILEKSALQETEFDLLISLMYSRINITPMAEFKEFIGQAGEVSPDPDDSEYFELALLLKCPIWSNDRRLKNQESVTIFSTQELVKIISNIP